MIPRHHFKVLIAYPNLSMMLTPSYAVGLFTAILRRQGYTVDLFDCTPYLPTHEFLKEAIPVTRANKLLNSRKFDPIQLWGKPEGNLTDDFVKKLEEYKPHAIIYSTLVEDTFPQLKELLEVQAHYPDAKHLIGGVFTTMAPDFVMREPLVQQIGIGEGEETIVEFCEAVRNGLDTRHVKGTWARNEDGNVIRNTPRALININKDMADFSLFDQRRFLRPLGAKVWKALPLETYRGCPYTCTFCNSPTQKTLANERGQGNYLRRKTMATLQKEMRFMMEHYDAEFFYINDDAFMARPKQEIKDFTEMHGEFKIPFWFQTRFEDVDEEKLEWAKDVGCYRISFGLEHGNEKYRKEILHRNITNERILEKAEVVAKSGIPFTLNIIVGFPYETRALLFDSVEFIRQIRDFDSLSVNVFVPYHGTVLREMALKEGWLDPNRQTTSVIAESILTMSPPYLSGEEILGLQRAFPLYVKMPKSEWSEIQKTEKFDREGDTTFEVLSKKWYEMTYGMDEADRMLTYVG